MAWPSTYHLLNIVSIVQVSLFIWSSGARALPPPFREGGRGAFSPPLCALLKGSEGRPNAFDENQGLLLFPGQFPDDLAVSWPPDGALCSHRQWQEPACASGHPRWLCLHHRFGHGPPSGYCGICRPIYHLYCISGYMCSLHLLLSECFVHWPLPLDLHWRNIDVNPVNHVTVLPGEPVHGLILLVSDQPLPWCGPLLWFRALWHPAHHRKEEAWRAWLH